VGRQIFQHQTYRPERLYQRNASPGKRKIPAGSSASDNRRSLVWAASRSRGSLDLLSDFAAVRPVAMAFAVAAHSAALCASVVRRVLLKRHLSASQRLAKSRRQSIFFRAKPPINPLQASIAPATWQVKNAFVAYCPQRQLSLDRASRRHGGVDAE
jgi:hypothetical protein